MRCLYINLDKAEDRRRSLEQNFRGTAPKTWTLERVSAAGPADVSRVPGRCTPAEKGCFASHIRALEMSLSDAADVLIVEDDEMFSARSFEVIETILAMRSTWDVLFTDLALVEPPTMVRYGKLWGDLTAAGRHQLDDLSKTFFAGSSAYVVRGGSKRRLLDLLTAIGELDTPYDLVLQALIHGGQISGRMCFPFITTLGPLASDTQIQSAREGLRDRAFNTFRRLMFVDRDLAACSADGAILEQGLDEGTRLCGLVYATLTSRAVAWA
jgi:GR25 family glycosyltransferase involved in LPS biosynthesis